jgi:hypothetical protein
MSRLDPFALGCGVLLLCATSPALALGTIQTGAASFGWLNFGTNGDASAGFADLKTGSTDHLRQHWFYYRLEGGAREFPLPLPASESYADSPGLFNLSWAAVGGRFDAHLTGALAQPVPGQARLTESLTITNTGSTDLNMAFFVYADVDVRDVFGGFDDTAALLSPVRMRIDDFGTFDFAEFAAPGAVAFNVQPFPYLRDFQLVDSGPDDMNDTGLPFAQGNFTGGFEWHLFLGPGAQVVLPVVLSVNTTSISGPAPHEPHQTPDFIGINWTGLTLNADRDLGLGQTLGSSLWDRSNALAADHQGTVYAVGKSALIRLDPSTGKGTFVVGLPIDDVRGLSFSPIDELWAVSREDNGADTLVRINRTSGAVTVVGPTGLSGIEDLAFAADGTLCAWHDGPGLAGAGLLVLDPLSGAATDPFPAVGESGDVRSLTFTQDGALYGARHQLYRIDPSTGVATLVGGGGYFDVSGLAPLPDTDLDHVPDAADSSPGNPNVCQDLDLDSCDDCTSGAENLAADGPDTDLDGKCNAGDPDDDGDGALDAADCAPLDATAALAAGPASALSWSAGAPVELFWTPGPHATASNVYRGTLAPQFNADWSCLASSVSGSSVTDSAMPAPGQGFHYEVSGENACGESSAGADSGGTPHAVTPCP